MGQKTENMLVNLDTTWKVITVMLEVTLRAAIKLQKGRCGINLYDFLLSWQHNKAKVPSFVRSKPKPKAEHSNEKIFKIKKLNKVCTESYSCCKKRQLVTEQLSLEGRLTKS